MTSPPGLWAAAGRGLPRWRWATSSSGDGRWCIVDLVGKHGRVRTVPMPTWVKLAIDSWTTATGVVDGHVFRSVDKAAVLEGPLVKERPHGDSLTGRETQMEAYRRVARVLFG